MGLFDAAIRAATGAEKEALGVLRDALGLLGSEDSPEARRGAARALRAVLQSLKKRGVSAGKAEAEAESLIRTFEEGRP
jgi:hypothetical protein